MKNTTTQKRLTRAGLLTPLGALVLCTILLVHQNVQAEGNHACDYLDKETVAEVMGQPVLEVESQPANPMGQTICFFSLSQELPLRFVQLQMMRSDWGKRSGTGWDAASLFTNNMDFLETAQPLEGIGEKAYWGGAGLKLGAGLHVLGNDTYFTMLVAAGGEEASLEKAKAFAEIILAKGP